VKKGMHVVSGTNNTLLQLNSQFFFCKGSDSAGGEKCQGQVEGVVAVRRLYVSSGLPLSHLEQFADSWMVNFTADKTGSLKIPNSYFHSGSSVWPRYLLP
jgi:hypothetical protein